MNTLFDQLDARPLDFDCVAMTCNTTPADIGFRIALREIPAFPGPFTIGDAAIAYFSHMLKQLESMYQRNGEAK